VASSSKTKASKLSKAGGEELEAPTIKFMKREELAKSVTEKMQSWYEIRVEGRETVCKYVFSYFHRLFSFFLITNNNSISSMIIEKAH
jgi:hypothetical protein